MSITAEPYTWFLEPFWMKGKINMFFGPEKAGKSRMLGWLLAGLFANVPVLDGLVHPTNLPERWLYLAGEEQLGLVVDRLRMYYQRMGGDPQRRLPVTFIEAPGMRLEQTGHREGQRGWLEKLIVSEGFDGLIIEPMRRIHAGTESDNDSMAPMHNDFRRWTNKLGITIIGVHHTGKLSEFADMSRIATWSRGCTDLAAILDTGQFLEQLHADRHGRRLRMLRGGRFPPVDPLFIHDAKDPAGFAIYKET
jgi:RecA-family ATPase